MGEERQVVLLTGASGSMGFESFKLLWEHRNMYDIVLLLRPSRKNKRKFRRYEKLSDISPIQGKGTVQGKGLKIVWGDGLNREDIIEACQGIDWCLHTMALISPAADRDPEMARRVNIEATSTLVEAIEAENPDHIRMIYIGSVAMYGDRMPPVQVGRVGDPLLPSVYDHYSLSKIGGELALMESRIRHKASIRQTFIMIPDLFSLKDPIMFHQPINSFMENITARDAGRLLFNCLKVPGSSDFWGGYYNASGGMQCRTTYLEFLQKVYQMLGLDYRKVMKREWFALKNFHMMFYEDGAVLNNYLHHWEGGQSLDDHLQAVWKKLPWYLKVTAWYNKYIPPYRIWIQWITCGQLKKLARHPEGTLGWIRQKDTGRIDAFYGSMDAYSSIPGWGEEMPSLDHNLSFKRLDHGYDENKEKLIIDDLQTAARFRGGSLISKDWEGDMGTSLIWKCCRDHTFSMTPQSVLKGGHWCVECISPPWEYGEVAAKSEFARQVFYQVC